MPEQSKSSLLYIFQWVLVIHTAIHGMSRLYNDWVDVLAEMDIKILALSDTIGVSSPESISYLFSRLIPPYPDVEFGAHLHTTPGSWYEKVHAAFKSGCRRFDSTIKGYGGCPMAKDELTGNMATENLVEYFKQHSIRPFTSRGGFDRRNALCT